MTDILDEQFGQQSTPVNLDELMGVTQSVQAPPTGAVRNRAATTAMLSEDSSKAVDNYQAMMQEGAATGGSTLVDAQQQQIKAVQGKSDLQGLMSVLSDPKVDFETKQRAAGQIKNNQFLNDTANTLHTKSLAKASPGENVENEDARLSSINAIREIYQARTDMQGLVNAHAASLQTDSTTQTFAEMNELWVMPFGNNINAAKVAGGLPGAKNDVWSVIKRYALGGTTTANIVEHLANIPPSQRAAFTKDVLGSIGKNSGILFSNDNQFAQFDKASTIFGEGGYSSTQEFLDNITPLLDIVGLGQTIRGGGKVAKVVGKADKVAPEFTGGARAGRNAFDTGVEDVPFRDIKQPGTGVVDATPTATRAPRSEVGPYTGPVTVGPAQTELMNQTRRIEMRAPVAPENPASPAKIIQQSNPEDARTMHAAVVNSPNDEAAEGLYGTSKVDAVVSDVFPQVMVEDGKVTSKVVDIDRNLAAELKVPDEIMEMVHSTGGTQYTRGEKATARALVVNDFKSAEGLVVNDAMSSFAIDGGQIKISAVYGMGDGGFLKARDAMDQAKLALRNYGIRDDELQLLSKQGLDHVPVRLEDVGDADGQYYVRVTTSHEIDPTDISALEKFDVKRNFFDRIGGTVSKDSGSLTRNMFDASSLLHPTYTGAASVASDMSSKFEKRMLNLASDYSDKYVKLPKERRAAVDDYIREANYNELALDHADLVARGFDASEISALQSWRQFWDSHYYLENHDVVRTLNAQGYQKFKNATTELYAKPIAKNQNIGNIYDPTLDAIVQHSKAEGDIFYAAGGTYAKLRRPASFGGVTTEYMMVRNTPTEYLRAFRDSDAVLNYRNGYFQLQYKAPRFVDQIVRDGAGNEIGRKTLAVAGDTAEAQRFADRLASTQGLTRDDFVVRGDDRGLKRDSDSYFDVNSASGRIAQRYRGKLLEDASGLNHLGDGSYILNHVDSAQRAARSISGRTVSRPMLEGAKARFINQYGQYLPSNGMGGRKWPTNVKEIGAKGMQTASEVADARTTYEYIRYLENGYINGMDEVLKTGFNALADLLGKKGYSLAERGALKASEVGVTSLAKNGVFQAYIGSNFLRQLIVQPHQMLRTFSYNPVGWLKGSIPNLLGGYTATKMGANTSAEMKAFTKFIDDSGMLDSVDKANLVRGSLVDAADSSNKITRYAGQALAVPRKIGFDMGEAANILVHATAVYERRMRAGQNMADKVVRDEAYAEIRAISYEMNFAGDMPYNQTSMAAVMQFLQVPHKAFLQATNRRIDRTTRAQMILADMLMWGTPTGLVAAVVGTDILPDNPKLRETLVFGLESMLLNNMFNQFFDEEGDKSSVDFTSLAPYDVQGWMKLFSAGWSGGVSKLIANSPAGQLFLKDGGRLRTAVSFMQRYFASFVDYDEDAPTFLEVTNEVAKISSGWSNIVKAKLALETRKRYDQYGSAIDSSVTPVEAVMQGFGFGTSSTRDLYDISQKMSGDVKKHKEDTLKVYNDVKRYYTEHLQAENSDPKFITKVTGQVFKIFENDPMAMAVISHQMALDFQGKDAALISLFMKRAGIPDAGTLRDQIKMMPVDETQKAEMLQMLEDTQNIHNANKKVK